MQKNKSHFTNNLGWVCGWSSAKTKRTLLLSSSCEFQPERCPGINMDFNLIFSQPSPIDSQIECWAVLHFFPLPLVVIQPENRKYALGMFSKHFEILEESLWTKGVFLKLFNSEVPNDLCEFHLCYKIISLAIHSFPGFLSFQ